MPTPSPLTHWRAAYGLVQGVNANRGGTLMVKDVWQLLDSEAAEEFKKHINRAENFLKHADRDPDTEYTLDTRWTEALLVEASQKFCELTGENPPLLALACVWFIVCHPEVLDRAWEAGIELPSSFKLSVFPKDRRRFFEEFLPVATTTARRPRTDMTTS